RPATWSSAARRSAARKRLPELRRYEFRERPPGFDHPRSSGFLSPLTALGRLRRELQAPKSHIPESFNESPQLFESFGPNRIEAFRSHPTLPQKAGTMQDAQMLGYRRAGSVEVRSNVAGGHLAATDELKDLQSNRTRHGLNGREDRHFANLRYFSFT